MTAFTMTALKASNIFGAGRKDVSCTFSGPTVYERANGGSILDLSSKPAAATPVSAAALTSPMLTSVVNNKVEFFLTAAIEQLYRLRYVPGAGAAPALGRAKVFGPPITTVTQTITTAMVVAGGAGVGPTPVGAAMVCPADHAIVGGCVRLLTTFAAPAATALYLDLTSITTAADIVDSTTGTHNLMTPANVGVRYTGVGAVSSETVFGPGTAATLYPVGDILVDATSVGGNLNTFTAGTAVVDMYCVNRQAFVDVDGWVEVAEGTNLSAVSFDVMASGT